MNTMCGWMSRGFHSFAWQCSTALPLPQQLLQEFDLLPQLLHFLFQTLNALLRGVVHRRGCGPRVFRIERGRRQSEDMVHDTTYHACRSVTEERFRSRCTETRQRSHEFVRVGARHQQAVCARCSSDQHTSTQEPNTQRDTHYLVRADLELPPTRAAGRVNAE